MTLPIAITTLAPDGHLTPAQRRRLLLDICRRRIKPGTGSSYEFLQRRTAMNPWPDLRSILHDLAWVIVGAVATRAYMPERATKDLDILVAERDGEEVIERLEAAGYHRISRLTIPGYLLHSPDGVEVDIIFGNYPWLAKALAQPHHDAAGYPVLDLPYLVLMKTDASRGRDIGDLTTMLGLASETELARVRDIINRYAPDVADDIESLIYLGQIELKVPPQSPDSKISGS
ncbi:MAG: hypothetical protein HYR94_25730 [Chloroflexi bacterium]|nr:hypothetical protein [Chloroflexota bacterium]